MEQVWTLAGEAAGGALAFAQACLAWARGPLTELRRLAGAIPYAEHVALGLGWAGWLVAVRQARHRQRLRRELERAREDAERAQSELAAERKWRLADERVRKQAPRAESVSAAESA